MTGKNEIIFASVGLVLCGVAIAASPFLPLTGERLQIGVAVIVGLVPVCVGGSIIRDILK